MLVLISFWTDFVSKNVVRSRTDQPLSVDSTAPVFLCRHQSRPFLSSSGQHSGSSQRLVMQNR